jgi:hypothetical protein
MSVSKFQLSIFLPIFVPSPLQAVTMFGVTRKMALRLYTNLCCFEGDLDRKDLAEKSLHQISVSECR